MLVLHPAFLDEARADRRNVRYVRLRVAQRLRLCGRMGTVGRLKAAGSWWGRAVRPRVRCNDTRLHAPPTRAPPSRPVHPQ